MKPEIKQVDDKTVYYMGFPNLTSFHDYLKSNLPVNDEIFPFQSSLSEDEYFYGEPLEKAIEYCISGYNKGFDNFLKTSQQLSQAIVKESDNRKLVRSLYGGIPLAPLVAAGVPDCMLKYERDRQTIVRNIYFNLTYPASTTSSQIINRGLATLYMIQALEEKGEMINFYAFEMSCCYDEYLFLNIEKCYFPMVGKEFLRRNMFRLLESMPVKNWEWGRGYGSPLNEQCVRDFLHLSPLDCVISYPREMGIEGIDIYDDTIALIDKLGFTDEFDINKIKQLQKTK